MSPEIDKSSPEPRRGYGPRDSHPSRMQTGLPLRVRRFVEGARDHAGKLGIGLTALLALALTISFLIRPHEAPTTIEGQLVASVEVTQGPMLMTPASTGRTESLQRLVATGDTVDAGAVLETPVDDGAALRLGTGASLRLTAETRVQIASGSNIVLDRGAVYLDSQTEDTGLEVRTPLGTVQGIGTQFEVRLTEGETPTMRVRVREGKIILRHRLESHEAGIGEELTVHHDGTLSRGTTPISGSHWDGVLATAPIPKLEGLDLRSFLEWFSREGGWIVRYSDEQLKARASTIILHGDAEGLNPHQAATMALQGSGLAFRVIDGELVVAPADSIRP